MSRNKSHGIVGSFYHAIHSLDDGFEKKEKVVSVFVCNRKGEEAEKSFNSDWAEKLAEGKKRLLVE